MDHKRPASRDQSVVRAREILIQVWDEKYEEIRKADDFEKAVDHDAASLWDYLIDRDTRTFCILTVSFMEDVFRRAFEHHWSIQDKGRANDFFGSNGPLNTFSQRILVAGGLGWVRSEDERTIGLLRKIRNELAHNHRVHRLDEDPLLSLAEALQPAETVWYREDFSSYREAYDRANRETVLRMRVYANSMFQVSNLISRAKRIGAELPPNYRTKRGWQGLTEIEPELHRSYHQTLLPHPRAYFDRARRAGLK